MKSERTVRKPTGHTSYLGKYEEFGVTDLLDRLNKLLDAAQKDGWSDCTITFESTLEPYESNYPGDVEIVVHGTRPMTEEELEEEAREDEIYNLAVRLGITIYEASIYLKLKESGKISS